MLNALDKTILEAVTDLKTIPGGAYNIRKNGQLLERKTTDRIMFESLKDRSGISVTVKPFTVNEILHIPVIVSQAGLNDVVYNKFVIGEGCDVTIVAGCGLHCSGSSFSGHEGIHEFFVGESARVKYVEKHVALGDGKGKRALHPTTKVFMEQGSFMEMELTQLGGVDDANRINEAVLGPESSLTVTERVMTDTHQSAVSKNEIILEGHGSRANLVSRSVIKGDSRQDFFAAIEAKAKCFGHIECDAIIMDNGVNETVPALRARHPDAELTHEASIGKIANDQLVKIMSMGLSYDEAVNWIIQGFLK